MPEVQISDAELMKLSSRKREEFESALSSSNPQKVLAVYKDMETLDRIGGRTGYKARMAEGIEAGRRLGEDTSGFTALSLDGFRQTASKFPGMSIQQLSDTMTATGINAKTGLAPSLAKRIEASYAPNADPYDIAVRKIHSAVGGDQPDGGALTETAVQSFAPVLSFVQSYLSENNASEEKLTPEQRRDRNSLATNMASDLFLVSGASGGSVDPDDLSRTFRGLTDVFNGGQSNRDFMATSDVGPQQPIQDPNKRIVAGRKAIETIAYMKKNGALDNTFSSVMPILSNADVLSQYVNRDAGSYELAESMKELGPRIQTINREVATLYPDDPGARNRIREDLSYRAGLATGAFRLDDARAARAIATTDELTNNSMVLSKVIRAPDASTLTDSDVTSVAKAVGSKTFAAGIAKTVGASPQEQMDMDQAMDIKIRWDDSQESGMIRLLAKDPAAAIAIYSKKDFDLITDPELQAEAEMLNRRVLNAPKTATAVVAVAPAAPGDSSVSRVSATASGTSRRGGVLQADMMAPTTSEAPAAAKPTAPVPAGPFDMVVPGTTIVVSGVDPATPKGRAYIIAAISAARAGSQASPNERALKATTQWNAEKANTDKMFAAQEKAAAAQKQLETMGVTPEVTQKAMKDVFNPLARASATINGIATLATAAGAGDQLKLAQTAYNSHLDQEQLSKAKYYERVRDFYWTQKTKEFDAGLAAKAGLTKAKYEQLNSIVDKTIAAMGTGVNFDAAKGAELTTVLTTLHKQYPTVFPELPSATE